MAKNVFVLTVMVELVKSLGYFIIIIIIIIIRALQQPHEDEQKRSEVRII